MLLLKHSKTPPQNTLKRKKNLKSWQPVLMKTTTRFDADTIKAIALYIQSDPPALLQP